jgi:Asp-tRNA(Asn)/Glu-tRNA(Gln) amidotransferase A subunit family amidase
VDGLPLGVKDVSETEDMPTEMNSPAWAIGGCSKNSARAYVDTCNY